MKRSRHNSAGFTLLEVLLVLLILGMLATVGVMAFKSTSESAKIDITKVKIQKVMGKVNEYALRLPYPTTEQGIKALIEKPTFEKPEMDENWRGPYLNADDLKDAWGNDLQYKLEDVDVNGQKSQVPRIYSFGPDGTDNQGGEDDIKDSTWAAESKTTTGG